MSDHLIVVPAFDEAPSIERIVTRARRHGIVLVVDDGSADDSARVASAAGADVIRLDRRHGKGAALRRGFREALARGVDRVVTLDADGQHDPDDIPRLLKAAAEAPDALVIGGRLGSRGAARMPSGRLAALGVAGFFINWLTVTAIADTQSGFRVYPAALLRAVTPRSGCFVLETEMLLRAAAAGWRLVEVPIAAIQPEGRRSRFRPLRDGIAVGAYLARHILLRWARELLTIAAALVRPFTAERRRPRHRAQAAFAAGHAGNLGTWALATGVFTINLIVETWSGWWRDPRARCLRLVGVATAATPLLLALALVHALVGRRGRVSRFDRLTAFAARVYSQEALARVLPEDARATRKASAEARQSPGCDVLVIGGGPGGATAATLLARGGLSVALVERDAFPRFRVGESLLPANIPLFERLGVLDQLRQRGFITKYGASFHDQETGLEYTFSFREGQSWPHWAFEVPRAEFDQILLDHARSQPGVTVLQPASVEEVRFDPDGVDVRVSQTGATRHIRARFLVDASGRDAFLASRFGRRQPAPGLGKVALFAHFRGARRWPGREEGNIRIFIFEDGWFWWIPFAGDVTSIGCVLHARTVRGREGALHDLFDAMIRRCRRVGEGLEGAHRITAVQTAANFSYHVDPVVGNRFLCVGDAMAFVDPIFSSGVYVAMQSAELAAAEILGAFDESRFEAARFVGYERRIHRGIGPFLRFIRHYYEPSFLEVFLRPRNAAGMRDTVLGVLAGGGFVRVPVRMWLGLEAFFAIVRITRWRRRRDGRPIESRLEW
jgi:2-polyprenyl-6-methoxyphenol hydroxylase-like FAD-dependent oxidoreductase